MYSAVDRHAVLEWLAEGSASGLAGGIQGHYYVTMSAWTEEDTGVLVLEFWSGVASGIGYRRSMVARVGSGTPDDAMETLVFDVEQQFYSSVGRAHQMLAAFAASKRIPFTPDVTPFVGPRWGDESDNPGPFPFP
ncbi:hypothetical protein [Nocardioides coralli]|uniref:hypothetical protein n=1 Tax=Nocardioides coralli TaxID=2872154 RepID=UPI001CA45B37|nr:hypothetical protein [Nocardioides coralli]QZY30611.1 hypothetical protein K6T13_08215 [Nocardioides coralli]